MLSVLLHTHTNTGIQIWPSYTHLAQTNKRKFLENIYFNMENKFIFSALYAKWVLKCFFFSTYKHQDVPFS